MSINNPLGRLWRLVLADREDIISIYFYAILGGLLQLSVPIGVQSIIGFVMGGSMVTSIYVLIALVLFGVLLVGVLQVNQMKVIEKIQQNIFTRYAFEFAEKIPQFDLVHANKYYLPEKVNRFFDTLSLQKGLSKLLLDIPTASIQIIFGLLLLSLYHPIFIVFGLFLLFLLWIILKSTSKKGFSTSLEESAYKYAVVAWFQEVARLIKPFKLHQHTQLHVRKTDENVMGYLSARTAHFKVLLSQYITLVVFKVAITAAMLIVGAYLLLNQQLNIGEFIAAEIVILMVIGAIEKIITSLDSIYDVLTGLEKLATITESPLEKQGSSLLKTTEGIDIQLVDLNFKYYEHNRILENINAYIPSNSKVCLSGEEGSGKSSLLRLLSGHYLQFTGSILFNNIPINNYDFEDARQSMSAYLHEEDIFSGTVLENITMGNSNISTEKIITVAKKLGFEGFIAQLEQGFDTNIDSSGKKASRTLIKKILLLRAFCNDPKLLLLEEPWQGLSLMDKENIIRYLVHEMPHCTVVIASNDIDFKKQCQWNIELTNGRAETQKIEVNGN